MAARARARIAAAHDDWEDARVAISEREVWLARALDVGRAQLAAPQGPAVRRDDLARLAREAIDRLPPGRLEILVSAADAPLLNAEWTAAVGGDRQADVTVGVGQVEGGCIVRTADGRAVFDNTWPARHERLQATWRSAMADVYERAIATLVAPAGGADGG
jgi:vacuolar-type H+-ATPase subunit E/Vma4